MNQVDVAVNTQVEMVESNQINVASPAEYEVDYREKKGYEIVKRAFDIVASLCALTVLSPIFLITIIAIFLTDFGSPFFVQDRVGKNGELFKICKFRSMYKNAEQMRDSLLAQNEADGPTFKIAKDPRVTTVGRFIRKTSIDELPQLINILKGDMSVIGPRPFIPKEQAKLSGVRLLVRPGLSCYWQIGGKNSLTVEELIALDIKYIEERSLFVDFKIIIKTFSVLFKNENS